MTLSDMSTGPDWISWVTAAVLLLLSLVLIFGKGSWLIAGYNTSTKEEKARYDEKKLCRVVGIGLLVITILIMVSTLLQDILPAFFAYITIGIIVLDCAVIIILSNTICKKR
ncbi:MAG: DUF3784 domain-containing protein [Lachnospiraceae bacterium]|nr:DUF3784 domain-containing protein [Lachnospiraceae bacterium]